MSVKFVRCLAALAMLVSIFGTAATVRADSGTGSGVDAMTVDAPPVDAPPVEAEVPPGPETLDTPLAVSAANSLGVQFVHIATAANISSNWTVIDHPSTNGNPNAILIVTPNWNPGSVGNTYNNHPIGVWYTGGKWAIFNQDLAAMPAGAAFNVLVPTTGTGVFVHKATAANSSGDYTVLDNPLTNGNPNAIVLVTPNWNPGASGGTYNNHAIGVFYTSGKWAIFNQDLTAIPVNAAFNVAVLPAAPGVYVHRATAANSTGDYTTLDNALTNGKPNAIVFFTPNWNPGGSGATYNNRNTGIWYTGSRWAIFNQDLQAVPVNAAFNIVVLAPATDVFVHKANAANSGGDYTRIDHALTNGHPNAMVFVTPNWNPGGLGGTYSNHPIGVWYTGSAWAIFNQDVTAIAANAAFNIYIPDPQTNVFLHRATAANSAGDYTVIDNPLTNGNPNAVLLVTPNWNPGGTGGIYNNHAIGVFYTSGKWAIFNQDLAAVPANAAFNVAVLPAGQNVFVHKATAGNSASDYTTLDSITTNGRPNAIVFFTPNWNPGGTGGTYNNRNTGIWYTGSRWAIFNQNLQAVPVNAAFNVTVFEKKVFTPMLVK
jgi:hypothetical protein